MKTIVLGPPGTGKTTTLLNLKVDICFTYVLWFGNFLFVTSLYLFLLLNYLVLKKNK